MTMATYWMTTCPHCFGFGIKLTPDEKTAILFRGTVSMDIRRNDEHPVEQCVECKSTGWTFSDKATRHSFPTTVRKRWGNN